jgi:hypothetical protein
VVSQEFKATEVDVRPAVCVTVPEAGVVVAVVILKGEELAKLPQITGSQTAFPGKWYCASVSVIGQSMKFSLSSGEYSSIVEAEKKAQQTAKELAARVQQRTFETSLRSANVRPKQ